MPNNIKHFSIHADDVPRAKLFYEQAFGWQFEPWGPPGFFMISTGEVAIHGSLQQRQTAPAMGSGLCGFECTIGVANIDEASRAVDAAGGELMGDKVEIPGVGWVIQFEDTEGNRVSAMQYEAIP